MWWDTLIGEPGSSITVDGVSMTVRKNRNGTTYVDVFDPKNPFEIKWLIADGEGLPTNIDVTEAANPCGNPGYTIYETTPDNTPSGPVYTVRSQTWQLNVAIQAIREKLISTKTAIAFLGSLEAQTSATIAGNPSLGCMIDAAIQGVVTLLVKQRAAIRGEASLECNSLAAIAHDFEVPATARTAIAGNPFIRHYINVTIKGEAEKIVRINVVIVKNRTETILLEMENTLPQEFALQSVPNWPSSVKDWRTGSLGS